MMTHAQKMNTMNGAKEGFFWDSLSEFIQTCSTVQDQKLLCVPMSGWSVILKADFDTVYEGEPYTLMCIMVCEGNGEYLVRVWNQTIEHGTLVDYDEFKALLHRTFYESRPCLGINGQVFNKKTAKRDFLDYPQIASKHCNLIYTAPDDSEGSNNLNNCLPCQTLIEKKMRKVMPDLIEEDGFEDPEQIDLDNLLEVNIKVENNKQEGNVLGEQDYEESYMDDVVPGEADEYVEKDTDDLLKCRDCHQLFQSKGARRAHEKASHNYGNFQCLHCDVEKVRLQDYVTHYMEKHPDIKHVACQICNEDKLIDKSFNMHYSNCKKRELVKYTKKKTQDFVCTVCGFKTKYPKSLKRHVENKHRDSEDEDGNLETKKKKKKTATKNNSAKSNETFNCRECQLPHKTSASRYLHEKKAHAFGLFKCDHCGISSWKLDDHIAHIMDIHPNIKTDDCTICKEEQNIHMDFVGHYKECFRKKRNDLSKAGKDRFWEKLVASNTYRFTCTICDFKTNYRDSIANHKNMHERETNKPEENNKFYKFCDQCGKKFLAKRSLDEHIKVVHLKEVIFAPCDQCHETFNTKLLLRRHRNMVHSTDPKFNCPECGKRFGTTSDVSRHLASHTGSTRCICKECGANVAKEKMKAHERTHTGEKPYPCTLCDMKFVSSSTLSGHLRQKHNTSISEEKRKAEMKEEVV